VGTIKGFGCRVTKAHLPILSVVTLITVGHNRQAKHDGSLIEIRSHWGSNANTGSPSALPSETFKFSFAFTLQRLFLFLYIYQTTQNFFVVHLLINLLVVYFNAVVPTPISILSHCSTGK
jgi:hypothetical protein